MRNLYQREVTGDQETDTADDVGGPDENVLFRPGESRYHGISCVDVKKQGPDKLYETGAVAGIMGFPGEPAPALLVYPGRRIDIRHVAIDGFQ